MLLFAGEKGGEEDALIGVRRQRGWWKKSEKER